MRSANFTQFKVVVGRILELNSWERVGRVRTDITLDLGVSLLFFIPFFHNFKLIQLREN